MSFSQDQVRLAGQHRWDVRDDESTPAASSTASVGYMGEESYLRNPSVPEFFDDTVAETAEMRGKILQVTGATVLPPQMLIDALADVYFDHVYPHYPIVDRADMIQHHSSPLLLLSLCLVGASYGHRRGSVSQISMANQFYLKVKTLLDVEHEKDNVVVLKALCLLTWRGDSDKMTAFCYGRLTSINLRATDVQLPSRDDFPATFLDSDVFIEKTKLCIILGRLGNAQLDPTSVQDDKTDIEEALSNWFHALPEDLRVPDGERRHTYRRIVSELQILYLACVVIYHQSVVKSEPDPIRSRSSLEECVRASSQITRLLEEIYYRNDVSYIAPINNWYCLLAGVIQIRARATLPDKRALRTEELGILKIVLQEMIPTVPSSNLILKNLERLEQASRVAPERSTDVPKHTSTTEHEEESVMQDDHNPQHSLLCSDSGVSPNFLGADNYTGLNASVLTPVDNWAFDGNFDFNFVDIQADVFMQEI
ncbi:hypothetical protein LTR84_007497 [Exophiala bonariae]|uniref:Xylanolytic transcriptional activator regulatory domain-containing protein n=1 Tax=Exophiala bonariae TaxID=1690606 RepID=A0AAV9N0L6_9EURO|nr:hypothetical protein LTR84_007497 [Exophiala bonariae]